MSHVSTLTTQYLREFAAYAKTQQFPYEPKSLYDPVRYSLAVPGKGVRPLLLMLAYGLSGRPIETVLPAAYAIELFHNFTLVHDDIMDAADLRRGRASVHVAFDEPTAILAGDAMLIHTYGYLLDSDLGNGAAQALRTFQCMAVALCQGQQRDMDLEHQAVASYADYLAMIHGKTGALITAALVMGAQLAERPAHEIKHLRRAGDLAGRAFQIQDDLLDTFSTSEQTGKTNYGDIVRGKQSAPFLRAIELCKPQQREWLINLYQLEEAQRRDHVTDILDLYGELAVEKSLDQEVNALTDEALNLLGDLGGNVEAREGLQVLTQQLASRSF